MTWNFEDFTDIDARLKLHCELALCEEENETVLMLCKAGAAVVIAGSSVKNFTSVVAVTNKAVYLLKVTRPER